MWWILDSQNVETSMVEEREKESKSNVYLLKYLFCASRLILMTNLKLLHNDFSHNEFATTSTR